MGTWDRRRGSGREEGREEKEMEDREKVASG